MACIPFLIGVQAVRLSADVHSYNSCYEICLFLFLCQLLHGIIQGVEEDVDVFFLILAGFLE